MATHKIRCGRLQKVCLCTEDLKDTAEGLELTGVSYASLHQGRKGVYQKTEGSVLKAEECTGCQQRTSKVKVKTGASVKNWKWAFLLCFLFYPILLIIFSRVEGGPEGPAELCWDNLVEHLLLKLTHSINPCTNQGGGVKVSSEQRGKPEFLFSPTSKPKLFIIKIQWWVVRHRIWE